MKTPPALLLAILGLAAPVASRAADVWVASSTEKIRPDAKARPAAAARVGAARNEFEAFQVVVTGEAKGVSVRAEADGGALPVRLFRADLIDARSASVVPGRSGWRTKSASPGVWNNAAYESLGGLGCIPSSPLTRTRSVAGSSSGGS